MQISFDNGVTKIDVPEGTTRVRVYGIPQYEGKDFYDVMLNDEGVMVSKAGGDRATFLTYTHIDR